MLRKTEQEANNLVLNHCSSMNIILVTSFDHKKSTETVKRNGRDSQSVQTNTQRIQSVQVTAKIKLSYSTQKPTLYIQSYIFNSIVTKVQPVVTV